MKEGKFAEGESGEIQALAEKAARGVFSVAGQRSEYGRGAGADLRSGARGEYGHGRGAFFAGDRDAVAKVLADFDRVFDVIEDNDAELTRQALEWAEQNGREAEIAPELRARIALSDGRSKRWWRSGRAPKRCGTLRARMRSGRSWRKRAW